MGGARPAQAFPAATPTLSVGRAASSLLLTCESSSDCLLAPHWALVTKPPGEVTGNSGTGSHPRQA